MQAYPRCKRSLRVFLQFLGQRNCPALWVDIVLEKGIREGHEGMALYRDFLTSRPTFYTVYHTMVLSAFMWVIQMQNYLLNVFIS